MLSCSDFLYLTLDRRQSYQRERTLNAGLRFELREIIETERLVRVALAHLVLLCVHFKAVTFIDPGEKRSSRAQ